MPHFRLALRQLLKSPGYSATVVFVLALGIGATTAIFSVVQAVLLNPFPYHRGNEILFVGSKRLTVANSMMPVTYPDYLDWKKSATTTDGLAFASGSSVTLTGTAEPAHLRNAAVSAETWSLLGMQPVLGRVFTAAEDAPAASPVVVLSHSTWTSRFQADPAVLGRAITLDGKPYTVIGVMPPKFRFWAGDVWTPAGLQADTDLFRSRVLRFDSWVVTRPKAGLTQQDVESELSVIAAQIARQHPDTNKDVGVTMNLLSASVSGPFRQPLLILLAAVGGVLLIACANVANLLLARTSARQREFAVRAALGASRRAILRQILAECLPLALLGGAAGVLLATWGLDSILAILPREFVPAESDIRVNAPVLLFSLALTLGTLLLFALYPAFESSRAVVAPRLQEGSRGTVSRSTARVRSALIVAEVALSLMLLVAAGLLIRSLAQASAADLGFNRENLLLAPVQLPESRYRTTEQATQFFEDAVARIRQLPGVDSVAATTNAPFAGGQGMPLVVEGKTYATLDDLRGVQFALVTGDYFRAQGLRLVQGRVFSDLDHTGSSPAIILNRAAVKEFLPDGDPLGKRVMLGVPQNLLTPGMLPPGLDRFTWATVVGVVEDARHFGVQGGTPPPSVYVPLRQGWDFPQLRRSMFLLVRTKGEPTALAPDLRAVVRSLDSDLPLERIAPMDMIVGETMQGARFNTILLGIFAGVALLLAAVGIYGVVSWNVTQRTREIGVRLALGAEPGSVLRLVVRQSMTVVGLGLVLGTAGALATAELMRSLVFGLSPFDPLTFVCVLVVLGGSALLACWLPSRRAARVDPLVALRTE